MVGNPTINPKIGLTQFDTVTWTHSDKPRQSVHSHHKVHSRAPPGKKIPCGIYGLRRWLTLVTSGEGRSLKCKLSNRHRS